VKGRVWLVVGVAVGIAIGIGKIPYLAGAATSLSDTSLRIVGTAELSIIRASGGHGATRRVVEGIAAVLGILVPGVTAVLLIYVARATLRVRSVIAVLLLGLGFAAFVYLPKGPALGVVLLAIVAAGIAVLASGPLIAAPLAALAALIGTSYLPRLLSAHSTIPHVPVEELHQALYGSAGSPFWLRVIVLVVAALPFAWAARLAVR
jgi:hypothetical protein